MDIATLDTLIGEVVAEAIVEEMALYGPDDAPVFDDPRLPFVQALVLELRLADGRGLRFVSVQNDVAWSVFSVWSAYGKSPPAMDPALTIFRVRPMSEFPTGRIEAIDTLPDGPGHQSITMRVGGRDVILCAGEVYEGFDDSLTIHERDENVLVFVDADAYQRTIFGQPIFLS